MAASRDKLNLTRHHPIHAQNLTIWSLSTAQVPCSCLGSTCSEVSSRPPCFEFFVMEGHSFSILPVLVVVFVPDVSTRPGSLFFKNWPDVTTRPPCRVDAQYLITSIAKSIHRKQLIKWRCGHACMKEPCHRKSSGHWLLHFQHEEHRVRL